MLRLCVVLLLVAMASACSELQKMKMKAQWAQAYNEGLGREAFGQALWRAFFHMDPGARRFFTRVRGDDVKSPQFQAHIDRVLSGLDMSISLLDDMPTFNAQLDHLQHQHIEREIPSYYFDEFGRVIQEVVPAAIGRCYDASAWKSCYSALADKIKSGR